MDLLKRYRPSDSFCTFISESVVVLHLKNIGLGKETQINKREELVSDIQLLTVHYTE